MALDGWTRIGDQIEGTGRWVLYRHKGTALASIEVLEELAAEQAERASRVYDKRAEGLRRGGLWLVSPQGRVCGVTFIRP
jgi:hypothetical protein